MDSNGRITGIDVMGDVPWGFHACMFYKTRQDLIDVFIPYLKAGLENNEFCMFIAPKPDLGDAEEQLSKAIPDFGEYLKKGQMEMVDSPKFYFRNNKFDAQRIFKNGTDKLTKALDKKYDGMRVFSETGLFRKAGWKNVLAYEQEVNERIEKLKVLAICGYPLAKCRINEAMDMMRSHQFALLREQGRWNFFRSFDNQGIEAEINKIKELLPLSAGKERDAKDFRKIFKEKIREERKKRGLTQEEFAKKAGVSVNFLGQIERGTRMPNFKKIISISEAFGIDLKYLFGDFQVKRPEKDKFTEKILSVLETTSEEEKKFIYRMISFLISEIHSHKGT